MSSPCQPAQITRIPQHCSLGCSASGLLPVPTRVDPDDQVRSCSELVAPVVTTKGSASRIPWIGLRSVKPWDMSHLRK